MIAMGHHSSGTETLLYWLIYKWQVVEQEACYECYLTC